MISSTDYKFEYISPTILRGDDDRAFLLFYSDVLGRVEFGGYEPRHGSGGMIDLLSEEDWDALYPARKGQRDLILQRLIEYSRTHPHYHFIERSLQKRQLLRRVSWVLGLTRWVTSAAASALLYVSRQRHVPAILEAFAVTGRLNRPRAAMFALAVAGLLLFGLLSQPTTKSDTDREAIRRAEQQYGPKYDYLVLRVDKRVGRITAIVVAYNEQETRQIELEWQPE